LVYCGRRRALAARLEVAMGSALRVNGIEAAGRPYQGGVSG